MKAVNVDKALIDGYLRLLSSLSTSNKLALISMLNLSVRSDVADKKKAFEKSFGAFDSTSTADEINTDIRDSRKFGRHFMVN